MRIIDFHRGLMTALGAGIAGGLVWVAAAYVGDESNGDYWLTYGIIAAGGLVLALSQIAGGWTKGGWPRFSLGTFLLGFIPVAIAVFWIAIGVQPNPNSARNHVLAWSSDVGIDDLVSDFREYIGVLAFGLGAVLGFCFDTTGPRRRAPVGPAVAEREVADEPTLAEHEEVETVPAEPVERDRELAGTRSAAGDGRRVVVHDDDEYA
jgi:hypothetical protein